MTLRTFNLLLILPPCLALSGIFIATLLLFERSDIYKLEKEIIGDETQIIQAFLEAQNFTNSSEVVTYLNQQLTARESYINRSIPNRPVALFASTTGERLLAWPSDFTPTIPGEILERLLQSEDYAYFDGNGIFSLPAYGTGAIPLQIESLNDKIHILLFAPNPKGVYLERELWIEVALICAGLFLVGIFLAEALTYYLKRSLKKLSRDATAIHQRNQTFHDARSETPVVELKNLAASLETLRQSYLAVREQNAHLAEESNLLVGQRELADAYCNLFNIHNRLVCGRLRFSIFEASESDRVAFIRPFGKGAVALSANLVEPLQALERPAFIDYLLSQVHTPAEADKQSFKDTLLSIPPGLCTRIRLWHLPAEDSSHLIQYSLQLAGSNAESTIQCEEVELQRSINVLPDGPALPLLSVQKLSDSAPKDRSELIQNLASIYCHAGKGNILFVERLPVEC
jgi:hypothetical protein